MSVENLSPGTPLGEVTPASDDAALLAAWDQIERDNGSARGEDGKFVSSAEEETGDEGPSAAEEAGTAAQEATESGEQTGAQEEPPATPTTPLPANWVGLDAEWGKIPAEVQEKIAGHQAQLHARMSDQGRQIAELRPLADITTRNRDLFDGRKMPDGRAATAQTSIEALFAAQRGLEADPLGTLLEIADMYGVRQHLAQALGTNPAPEQPGVSRAELERISRAEAARVANEALSEHQRDREGEELIGRLSKDKPLFQEIPSEAMIFHINNAKAQLGEAASPEAVFNLAYDMAVHADPKLRAKIAAPPKPQIPTPDPRKAEGAKRAASVNLTSTSTGRGRQLTEDELLARTYDQITEKA